MGFAYLDGEGPEVSLAGRGRAGVLPVSYVLFVFDDKSQKTGPATGLIIDVCDMYESSLSPLVFERLNI